jgi:hypothetical protein
MLATSERVRGDGGRTEVLVWHKPVGRCDGECDFHAIACSAEEGIVLPSPKQDVPISLDKLGERWCPTCLAIIRSARTAAK